MVQSAAANAVNNFGFDEETLSFSEIQSSNDSIKKMKRFRPRAKVRWNYQTDFHNYCESQRKEK